MTGSVIDKTVICREAEHIKELFRGEINEAENELIAYVEEEKNRPVETQEGRRAADDTVECLVSRGGYCYNIRKGYYSQQFSVGSGGRE